MTGKPPFKLGYFNAAIREQHAADAARIAHLEGITARQKRMDEEAADRRKAAADREGAAE